VGEPHLQTFEKFQAHNEHAHPGVTVAAFDLPKLPWNPITEKNYLCHLCPFYCGVPKKLETHLSVVHNVNEAIPQEIKKEQPKRKRRRLSKPFACELCPFSYLAQELLDEHVLRRHTNKSRKLEKKHACKECGKKFERQNRLEIHFNHRHLKKKGVKKTSSMLRRHKSHKVKRSHRRRPSIKEICLKHRVEVDKTLRIRLKRIDPDNILQELEKDRSELEEIIDVKPSLEDLELIHESIHELMTPLSIQCEQRTKITCDADMKELNS